MIKEDTTTALLILHERERQRATGFVASVACCGRHRRGMKPGKPFNYVALP